MGAVASLGCAGYMALQMRFACLCPALLAVASAAAAGVEAPANAAAAAAKGHADAAAAAHDGVGGGVELDAGHL